MRLLKKKKYLVFIKGRINCQGFYATRLSSPLHPSPFIYLIRFDSTVFSTVGVGKGSLLTKGCYPLVMTQRTKSYTASSLGQELFIQCIPYGMSHREALTWLRLSWVINKSVLIIMSSSYLGMRKWFITPICWIIHSSGAKTAWNMSSEDVEVFSMIGILFWY